MANSFIPMIIKSMFCNPHYPHTLEMIRNIMENAFKNKRIKEEKNDGICFCIHRNAVDDFISLLVNILQHDFSTESKPISSQANVSWQQT